MVENFSPEMIAIMNADNDTIAAIATPTGKGGVGIIRISGTKSKEIAKIILKKNLKIKVAHFGLFYDKNNEVIDQGLAILFAAPSSFTGEDVLELHAHGNPFILDKLLTAVLQLGARIAKPGEFSQRAFLNNKIDLAQAEAIADLISATSSRAAKAAINSLQGEFSVKIDALLELLIKLRMHIEAAIDFSEEEIDFFNDKKITESINEIKQEIVKVKNAAKQGVLLREGITIAIIGKPNAGKSSLLNCLSGRDSAIVTDMAGTTRDVIREYIGIDGIPLHIVDTAGLQKSSNIIEQEGIKRTWQEITKADEILLMVDSSLTKETDPNINLPDFFRELPSEKAITVIMNKIDLTNEKAKIVEHGNYSIIYMSVKAGIGIDLLKSHLKKIIGFQESTESIFIARRRHLHALTNAYNLINSAQQQLEEGKSIELIAEDLRLAHDSLAEITGKFTSEDLLDKIFASFCIGK